MNRLVRNYKLSINFSFVNFTILPSKQFQLEKTRITLRQRKTSFYPATIFRESNLRMAKSMYALPHRYETDINIHYLSQNSSSRLSFQAQRNCCHCYLGQTRWYPVVLSAFDSSFDHQDSTDSAATWSMIDRRVLVMARFRSVFDDVAENLTFVRLRRISWKTRNE